MDYEDLTQSECTHTPQKYYCASEEAVICKECKVRYHSNCSSAHILKLNNFIQNIASSLELMYNKAVKSKTELVSICEKAEKRIRISVDDLYVQIEDAMAKEIHRLKTETSRYLEEFSSILRLNSADSEINIDNVVRSLEKKVNMTKKHLHYNNYHGVISISKDIDEDKSELDKIQETLEKYSKLNISFAQSANTHNLSSYIDTHISQIISSIEVQMNQLRKDIGSQGVKANMLVYTKEYKAELILIDTRDLKRQNVKHNVEFRYWYDQIMTNSGRFFIIGGRNTMSSVYEYSFITGHFDKRADLSVGRRSHRTVEYANRYLVVSGGFDDTEILSLCEKYDMDKDSWSAIAPLNEKRSHHVSFSFDNTSIYVAMGSGINDESLCSFEKIVPGNAKSTWELLKVNNNKNGVFNRCRAIPIKLPGKKLLIIGGCKKLENLNDCCIYDEEKNKINKAAGSLSVGAEFSYNTVGMANNKWYVIDDARNLHIYDGEDWESKYRYIDEKDEGIIKRRVTMLL